jgi:HSP90 family molecular chaperone
MDAVDKRAEKENGSYEPKIWITIDIKENRLIVTDNGIGLDESQFKSFLAPFFSFKSKKIVVTKV